MLLSKRAGPETGIPVGVALNTVEMFDTSCITFMGNIIASE